jgi:hypothetical protein
MGTLKTVLIAAALFYGTAWGVVWVADACNHYLDREACLQSAQSDRVTWPDSYCQTINR